MRENPCKKNSSNEIIFEMLGKGVEADQLFTPALKRVPDSSQRGFLTLFVTLFFALLSLSTSPLFSQEKNLLDPKLDLLVETFKGEVYQEKISDSELERKYFTLKREVKDLAKTERQRLYYQARLEYWVGRSYQAVNDLELAVEFFDFINSEKLMKTKNLYPESVLKKSITYYEMALEKIETLLKENASSEILFLQAATDGELVLLKPFSYAMTHGLNVQRSLKKAVNKNNNLDALIMISRGETYTPKALGGNPKKGVEGLKVLLSRQNLLESDQYKIYEGLARGYLRLKNYESAAIWAQKSSEIYPQNTTLLALKKILNEKTEG